MSANDQGATAATDRELIDPTTVTCLGNGWHAVVALDALGRPWPWLLGSPDSTDHDSGCRNACCAPHEQTGPLPSDTRRRVSQCEAISRTTRCRCRNPAPAGEPYCRVHRRRRP